MVTNIPEKEKNFEFLEHISDLKFLARGKTLEECFQNSAKAMFSWMIDLNLIDSSLSRKIKISSPTLENLMHDFLSELLYLFETSKIIFRDFEVKIKEEESKKGREYELTVTAKGEKVDTKKHKIHAEIKAITYHDLTVKNILGKWEAIVICDI